MKKKKKKDGKESTDFMEYIRKEKKKHVPPSEKRSSYAIFSPSQIFGGWLGENKTCVQRRRRKRSFGHTNRQLHVPAF